MRKAYFYNVRIFNLDVDVFSHGVCYIDSSLNEKVLLLVIDLAFKKSGVSGNKEDYTINVKAFNNVEF